MNSHGTQKVVVQFTGQLPTNITEVGVILDSTATAHFNNNGNASADNGLGDESTYAAPGSDYSLVGLPGDYSTGKHLRVVKLNSAGYGELEFSSSATASSSGNGAQVWASAQAAGAVKDPRNLSLYVSGGQYYTSSPTNGQIYNLLYQHDLHTYDFNYWSPKYDRVAISPKSTGLYTKFAKLEIGLLRESRNINNNFYSDKVLGFSAFSDFPNAEQSGHGNYTWTLTKPNPAYSTANYPLSGTFPWVVSIMKEHSGIARRPNVLVQHFPAPWQIDLVVGEQDNDVGQTHEVSFSVDWVDGIKGEVKYEIEWKEASNETHSSPIFKISPPEYPLSYFMDRNLIPLPDGNTNGLWVLASSHDFFDQLHFEQYSSGTPQQAAINLGVDLGIEVLKNAGFAAKLAAPVARAGLNVVFGNIIDIPTPFPLYRDGAFPIRNINPIVQADWDAEYRSNLKWRVTVRQGFLVQFNTTMDYDENGFIGTQIHTNDELISARNGYHTLWVEAI
ncbi:MAG: hypothetical protein ACKVQS_02335 [Fimbriimonadaceae bacterium]